MGSGDADFYAGFDKRSFRVPRIGPLEIAEDARAVMHRILFPDGRASLSQIQRVHRLSYADADRLLQALNTSGWLEGLVKSPVLKDRP